jgi:hypothetical protein
MKTLPQLVSIAFALAISILSTALTSAVETGLTEQNGRARLQAARDEVSNLRSNIFLTLVALDQVRGEREPAGEHFQAFTNQLGRMEVLARAMGKRIDEMEKRGDAYFVDWEATTAGIQNQEARQRAEQKYAQRKKSYDAIGKFMREAKTAFLPFVNKLTSIKQLLEGTRDEKSVAAAKDLFMQANWNCIDVQRSLMQTEEELDKLAASFAKDG